MKAPVGAVVGITYDGARREPIEVGDYIRTRTGRTYRIIAARQQQRGEHVGRWHLRCEVVPAEVVVDGEDRVWPLWWYPRSRR